MSGYADLTAWYGTWAWWWLREVARDTWNGLPGPLWVKLALCALLLACLAIPGPVDEIIVVCLIKAVGRRSRRRAERAA
jgi:hypothetical protein